ncbi:phospholipid/cholesterol/gamma-HCH transport system substrate-binding protein [Crossiella equi]|uniref:Phospholipid/cholesterol/gamma-HCH transport system substrate-binding protein n=1 Tax=Crossiella equi TaxID=130796 RepID=A0ABS5AHR4_9PSEU|nr:MlaD family protein [Crossiella equi]MBP2476120.1 phospholipid/cholesterol/gamma-HCH transport system substrate-binding protein [Crossiella equi]
MITRRVRVQIIAFVVIALLGVSFVGARYAGLDRLFGARGYVVTMRLADSGGIFTNAEVAYRGVTVGRVGQLRLTATGLEVDLDIDSDTRIPADTKAVVTNRSAVGEQYVDLRPNTDAGPYLAGGSVISVDRTATPPPVETLLANLDGLTTSVPLDSLRTVVNELGTAFDGAGPQLQRLLDTTSVFTKDAVKNLPGTLELLRNARTVLGTQNQQGSSITSFSKDLRLLAAQLGKSDGDLRAVIDNGPKAAGQLSALLRESGQGISELTANLLTTVDVALPRKDGLEQAMVTYPLVVGGAFTVAPGDGTAHFGLAINLFDPPPCTKGYETTNRRPGNATGPVVLNTRAYCAEGPGSPVDVRGAQNAPYGGKPMTPPPSTKTVVGPARQPQPGAASGLLALLQLPGGQAPSTLAQMLGLPG